jgi:hypothetical protein
MGTFIGILLIELKLFGLSLRTPILSFIFFDARLIAKMIPVLGLTFIYGLFFFEDLDGFSKVNVLTFTLIIFGTWVMIILSFSKIYSRPMVLNIIKFSPIFFFTLVVFQFLNLGFWVGLFSQEYLVFYPRSSGLSSEPSFFSNMLFYFFILFFSFCKKNRYLIGLVFLLLFLSTMSTTLVAYFGLLCFVFGVFKLKIGRFKVTPQVVIFAVLLSLICVERLFYFISQESLSHLSLDLTGSWREVSLYAAIYGSNFIGPFSGGIDWSESLSVGQRFLSNGNDVREWIVWPWSIFSMLLCEIGVLPSLILLAYLGHHLNRVWYRDIARRSTLKWYTLSVVIGLFFAPKWCVYFFFFPLLNLGNSKLNSNVECQNN